MAAMRTNIFANLVTELDSDPSMLLQRELGIDKTTGILYYKDSDGNIRDLDVTSLTSDVRNSVNIELTIDNTRPNMVGSGYDENDVFIDRTTLVNPTLIHNIVCTATGASQGYVVLIKDELGKIIDYTELPGLYKNGDTADVISLGEGNIRQESMFEYSNVYSRIELLTVDLFLISNKKHFSDLVTYPAFDIITNPSEADNVSSIGKVYYDTTNDDVYIVVTKGTLVTSVIYPDILVSKLEYPVTKNIQPFIPYVKEEYSIEIVKSYKIDTYSDENGEILYPSNIDVESVLVARSDISGISVSNVGIDTDNFKLHNMQANTSYYILLKLANPVDEIPEVVYTYVEFHDATLPNVMMAIDSLSTEFQYLRPTIIQIVEEYTKNYWDGYSPGFMEASFLLKTSATTFKIKTPLHDYDEAADICLLFKNGTLLAKNQDYRIVIENDEIFFEKLIDGVVDTLVGWETNTLLKAVVLIKTGVTDKNIIYRTYESAFEILHPNTTHIPIGIAEYNMNDEDILMVSQDNSMLFKNMNYTLKSGSMMHGDTEYIGPYIELIDHHAPAGSWFFFFVIKASRSIDPIGTIDPKRIRKGLSLEQFEGDLARSLITPNTILDKSLIVRPRKANASMIAMVDAFMYPTVKNGHLVIDLPFGWVDTNVSFTLEVKPSKNTSMFYKVDVNGFLSLDTYQWEETAVMMTGLSNTNKVTLAYHDGRACVILGNSDTPWDKCTVKITNFAAIGEKLDGWNTGWVFGIYDYTETTALGLTKIFLPTVTLITS